MIAKWVNITGRRVTNSTEGITFIVDAYANANPADENGIEGVLFTITDAYGVVTTSYIRDRDWQLPNFSSYTTTSNPNVSTDVAPVWAYGVTFNANTLPPGVVRATAVVKANNGTTYAVPGRITVYNDTAQYEVYPSPGAAYVSTRYTATVNGSAATVLGKTVTAGFTSAVWSSGASVEQSWLNFGSNSTAAVVISKVSGSISSAVVYPKDKGVTYSIAGGVLTLQVPTDVRLRIEINGDRANAFHLFASPLKIAAPSLKTDWTAVTSRSVSSINTTSNTLTLSSAHGWSAGQQVVLSTTGTLPAVSGTALSVYEPYYVISPSGADLQLARTSGGVAIDFTGTGTGTMTIKPASWSNTTNALYFGTGVHTIGRLFKLSSNVKIYIDGGAVVIGSFDLRGIQGVTIFGPGVVDGSYATRAQALAGNPDEYSTFFGYNGSTFTYSNTVQGITVVNTPFYLTYEGVTSWTNCHVISPWNYNCDGFDCSESPNNDGYVTNCYALTGDDSVRAESAWFNMTVKNTFMSQTNAGAILLSYWASPDQGNKQQFIDCDVVSLTLADGPGNPGGVVGANAIIKCWIDSYNANPTYGQFHTIIRGLRVWGPCAVRLFSVENYLYPFDGSLSRDAAGQAADWVVSDLKCEQAPGQISRLNGRDASNTPHDLKFVGITIAGTAVTTANWSTYVSQNSYVYNITLDPAGAAVVPDHVPALPALVSIPSTKVIYVDPSLGNDSNSGSALSPVQTIQTAILKARKNPAGANTSASDADCGGARIVLADGVYNGFGNTSYSSASSPWHTSDDWWLQIESPSRGAVIRRVADSDNYGSLYPQSFLFAPGWRLDGQTLFQGTCRIQFSGCVFEDGGNSISIGNKGTPQAIDLHCWIDGGESYSTVVRNTDYTVLYPNGSNGHQIIGVDFGHGTLYCTGHYRHHHADGWLGWQHVVDCVLEKYTGIALQTTAGKSMYVLNSTIRFHPTYPELDGYVWVADGDKLVVSVPSPGVMRVDSIASLTNPWGNPDITTSFGPEFAYIAAANDASQNYVFGVGFSGFPNISGSPSPNNGVFRLLSAGVNPNGTHYVICQNSSAVPQGGVRGATLGTTTQLFTGNVRKNLQYNGQIHPDILQFNADSSDVLLNTVTVQGIKGSQGYYAGNHALTNVWMVNVSDGGVAPTNNFTGSGTSLTRCGFINCSFTGTFDFNGSGTHSYTCFVDTVFNKTGSAPAHGTSASSVYYKNCHWEVQPPVFGADAARGVSPTIGSWYDAPPANYPYYLTPASSNLDTGSGYVPTPPILIWGGGVGDTKGVWANVGSYDWFGATSGFPSGSSTPAIVTTQYLLLGQLTSAYTLGVYAGFQTLGTYLFDPSISVSNDVFATSLPNYLTLAQLNAQATKSANIVASTLNLALAQVGASVSIPRSVTNSVLSLGLSQPAASGNISTNATNNSAYPLTISSLAATASVFTPPTLAVQSLTLVAQSQSVVISRLANASVLSMSLSAPHQVQEVIANAATQQLSLSTLPQTIVGFVHATNTPVTLALSSSSAGFGRGVNHSTSSTALSAPQQYGVTEVRVPVGYQTLLIAPVDVYQSNPATVVADALYLTFITLTHQVNVKTDPQVFGQNLRLAQPSASVTIGALATAIPAFLTLQQFPAESATSVNIVGGTQRLALTTFNQTAKTGIIIYHQTLQLQFTQPFAQVGTSANASHVTSTLQLTAFSATVPYQGNAASGIPPVITVSALPQSVDTSVLAPSGLPVVMMLTTFDVDAAGLVAPVVSEELITGKTRERVTDEILAKPEPDEEWRIVQIVS